MYYEPMKTTTDVVGLIEVIIDIVIRYYDLPESIISD